MNPPPDKLQHLGAGFFVYTAAYVGSGRGELSLGVSVGVGLGKEVWDRTTKKGRPEVSDFLWTVVGGLVGYVITERVRLGVQ